MLSLQEMLLDFLGEMHVKWVSSKPFSLSQCLWTVVRCWGNVAQYTLELEVSRQEVSAHRALRREVQVPVWRLLGTQFPEAGSSQRFPKDRMNFLWLFSFAQDQPFLGLVFFILSLFLGPHRRPCLPAGLHCRRSARHGHLCCWETSPGIFEGLRRQQWRSGLSLLFCTTDGRQPLNWALPAEIAGGKEFGQVSVLYLNNYHK